MLKISIALLVFTFAQMASAAESVVTTNILPTMGILPTTDYPCPSLAGNYIYDLNLFNQSVQIPLAITQNDCNSLTISSKNPDDSSSVTTLIADKAEHVNDNAGTYRAEFSLTSLKITQTSQPSTTDGKPEVTITVLSLNADGSLVEQDSVVDAQGAAIVPPSTITMKRIASPNPCLPGLIQIRTSPRTFVCQEQ